MFSADRKDYFFDIESQPEGAMQGSCHSKERSWDISPEPSLPTDEDASQGDSIPWEDPTVLQFQGSESHTGCCGQKWTQTWTIVPAGDPTP